MPAPSPPPTMSRTALPSTSGARAFVETEIVAITGRIIEAPKWLACRFAEALHCLLVIHAMEENNFPQRHDRAAEALADLPLPNDRRPFFWPAFGEVGGGVSAVAVGAEKLRPVGGTGGDCRQRSSDRRPSSLFACHVQGPVIGVQYSVFSVQSRSPASQPPRLRLTAVAGTPLGTEY